MICHPEERYLGTCFTGGGRMNGSSVTGTDSISIGPSLGSFNGADDKGDGNGGGGVRTGDASTEDDEMKIPTAAADADTAFCCPGSDC